MALPVSRLLDPIKIFKKITMKKILLYLLSLGMALSCLCLSSCERQPKKYAAHTFDYFDTITSITGYAKNEEEFSAVCADIFRMLEEYHRLYTVYERYEGMENLRTVNELSDGTHRTVKVDARIIDLLIYAKEMYEKTDGRTNVAMGSVLSVWHEYRERGMKDPKNASLPPYDLLENASLHTDIDRMEIDRENGTVTLTDPAMRLDAGAIAKGYAVEMIAKALEEKNIVGYLLNVGGNVRAVGAKPDGSPWTVGIENPDINASDPYAAYLRLSDESVVTSGSYQRYYNVDGKRYHHIIDPETLFPAQGYLSVSVVCKSSAMGDALSTALFCMTYEEGLALINATEGAEAMWIFSDGEKRYSEGFSSHTLQK